MPTARIDLRGKSALVTGAGKRVGAAIARALGAEGMRVAVHYHGSRDGAEATARVIDQAGGEAWPIAADLTTREGAERLIEACLDRFGGLDVLVPSAANFDRVPYAQVTWSDWDRAMRLNLEAPFALVHRARAALRASRGAVVFITCTSATVPYRDYLPYVVSKGSLQKLMRVLALELAPEVRVNAVAPGTVLPPDGMTEEAIDALRREIPLARIGSADDVSEAVVHLLRSPFVTGQELVIDGGRTIAAVPPRHDS